MEKILSLSICFIFLVATSFFALPSTKVEAQETNKKNVIVYFPNWGIYNSSHQSFSVDMIPWDKVTIINHSFFTVSKNFKLESIDTFADYDKMLPHSEGWDSGQLRGHFGEYKYYKTKYPNVKVLISIGGWTRGENFHDMAKTKETRKIFIDSLISFLKTYTFIDGFDIDWEYPGIDRPKDTADEYDRGCPGGPEDKENFTLLLKEIREAYNSNNMAKKVLTIAASAGYEKLALQEPEKYIEYLDLINVMTYDFHGAWENVTNHHSPLYANPNDPSGSSPTNIKERYNVDSAIKTLVEQYKIPKNKLNIGTPLYSRGWSGVDSKTGENGMFANATGPYKGIWDNPNSPGGQEPWFKIKQMENKNGWVKYRDSYNKSPWLYNKDLKSVLTYEDEVSLAAKLDYINTNSLGGIIVWEITGDDINGFPMISMMYNSLIKNSPTDPPVDPDPPKAELLNPTLSIENGSLPGNYSLKATSPANSTAVKMQIFENNSLIKESKLSENSSLEQLTELNFENKANGKYVYTVSVEDSLQNKKTATAEIVVDKITTNDIEVKFSVTSDWGTGSNYSITIKNNSQKDITDWSLDFNFDKNLISLWDANLTQLNNKYTVSPKDWNKTIKKSSIITLSGAAEGNISSYNIYDVNLSVK